MIQESGQITHDYMQRIVAAVYGGGNCELCSRAEFLNSICLGPCLQFTLAARDRGAALCGRVEVMYQE